MKPIDLKALLDVPYVDMEGGMDISPDGERVAFSWNRSGQWEIYEILVDGTQPARLLTQEGSCPTGAKSVPRYDPGGRYLAYLVDEAGSEAYDIWLLELESGRHTNLTPGTWELIQPSIAWSPDGKELAFIRFFDGRFSTFILSIAAGEKAGQQARLVCAHGGPHFNVCWSPDGHRLAITAQGKAQDHDIFLAPVHGNGKDEKLEQCKISINGLGTRWSPDGKYLVLGTELWGDMRIATQALDTGEVHRMTKEAPEFPGLLSDYWEEKSPEWSPDGRRLAFIISRGANTWIEVMDLARNKCEFYQVENGVHHALRFTPDSRYLLFVFESPHRPGDIWRLELSSGTIQPLTNSLPAEITPVDLVMPEEIWYPSPDGEQVPALLYVSPRESKALPPAVVVIHGGPDWLFQFLWYPIMSYFAGRGWVVLAPNYRGSTGYGREWQVANRFEMGRLDTMDVAAGVDYLVERGLADARRIAVTGRSHGGYLTMSCLTNYPQLWAAGSAVVPFLNWFTSQKNSRQDLQQWDRENMGDPLTHADLWRDRSPFFSLERIQAPVQLICGAHDQRCPPSESTQAREALMALGKTVDFILYPDEGHSFLKHENVVDHESRRAEWLVRHTENRV